MVPEKTIIENNEPINLISVRPPNSDKKIYCTEKQIRIIEEEKDALEKFKTVEETMKQINYFNMILSYVKKALVCRIFYNAKKNITSIGIFDDQASKLVDEVPHFLGEEIIETCKTNAIPLHEIYMNVPLVEVKYTNSHVFQDGIFTFNPESWEYENLFAVEEEANCKNIEAELQELED